MKSLRKLKSDDKANVDMILTAVIAGVMFAIAIPIIYSVLGGFDHTTTDSNFGDYGLGRYAEGGSLEAINGSTPALNASNSLLTNLNTFFTIGPIYLVVVAAVGIIAAVLLLRGR